MTNKLFEKVTKTKYNILKRLQLMTIADMKTHDQAKFWYCVLSFDSEILYPLLLSKNIKNSKEYTFFFC
jgi:CRISPR/Cas system-associated endonuclease Cas3-HD